MLFEIALALFLGILAGTLTGLTPGIHINLVVVALPFLIVFFPAQSLIAFIVALALTHTFIDTIPSIYLGAPDEDTALSTLPGHRLLKIGLGHQAVLLTLAGSIIATTLFLFVIPFFIFVVPLVFPFIEQMMGWFLFQAALLLIYLEKEARFAAFIVFLLSGFLGIATLSLPLKEPLLPLLSGLFATSTLLYSIKTNTQIPDQIIKGPAITKNELIKPTLATATVSPICSFFPGLGSSQSVIIGSSLFGNMSQRQFLILIGSTNTLVMLTSFLTITLLSKARTGAAHALQTITPLSLSSLPVIITLAVLTTLLATPLTIYLSKIFAKNIHKINYTKLSFIILVFLTSIITLLSGLLGLIVLVVSTLAGLTCIEFGVRRGFLMGALLIPTTLFYLPF